MGDPSLPLQDALIKALRADGVLPIVGKRVYDQVQSAPTYPYVSLGDGQVLPDKAECIDGVEVSLQIDVWSRGVGYVEAKQIGAAIIAALDDQPLTVDGFNVTVFELADAQYLRDPDGLTRHGAITFRALLEAST
ncbi:DUF3168 domain-containing protein [Bradyrhizobium barranii subsp. barranii]|uniref:DUF3168 domain-containing protein n=1 Tax=Bradyrhizobium barranii subsp. barranii TaxID=2823807 RepID=A0A7Z0QI74_9BRAD|nr:DUF3168 domain-containing protein [Bradyrhizobium barranii]UGX98234.1 DUF3168 domain-containing protein [Bradyrhizobium barranii subsp. barranii]